MIRKSWRRFSIIIFFILIILFQYAPINSSQAIPELSQQTLAKIAHENGDAARRRIIAWQKIIKNDQNLSELKKLEVVNHFFNLFQYKKDIRHYWMTPLEFLKAGTGDCKDYAIAKYFTLKDLGIASDKLRIVYVKALKQNKAHMVLTYYTTPDSEPLVLDSLMGAIKPASQRTDLLPVYSFNTEGLWLAIQRDQSKQVGSPDQLSNWQGVLQRMVKEERTY